MPQVTFARGPRAVSFGFLLFGSAFLLAWRWDSLGWHARGAILAAYGVTLLAVLLIPALRTRRLLTSGARAQGTVVGAKWNTSSGRDRDTTYYHPVIRFTTPAGRQVVFTSALGSELEPEAGSSVQVRYRADAPERAEVDRAVTWVPAAVFGLLGGLGLLVAGVVAYAQGSEHVPAGIVTKVEGTGQVQAVPASGRIGEMLTVYDARGDAQAGVTVARLKFSAGDELDQPERGQFMGVYVRLDAVVDQPDVPSLHALVGGRDYEESEVAGMGMFGPPLGDLMLEAGERTSGWLVFDVPDRHGQLVLRDHERKVGVWTY